MLFTNIKSIYKKRHGNAVWHSMSCDLAVDQQEIWFFNCAFAFVAN